MRCINIMIKVLFCRSIIVGEALSVDDIREDITAQYCPKVDICNGNASSATLRPNGKLDHGIDGISCCHGCSCHPDCKQNNNCCYPEEEITDPVCIHLQFGNDDADQHSGVGVPSFYTISAEPPTGCNDVRPFYSISGDTMTPSCNQHPVTYWDDYLPVLSKASKDIYKNEACARCHGITEYEPFTPYLLCKETTDSIMAGITLADHLNALERKVISPLCYVQFEHSDVNALSGKRCVKEEYIQDTCESQTYAKAMPPMGLTWDAMKSECEEGPKSPLVVYSKAFRNIFCAICFFPAIRPEDAICEEYMDSNRADFNALAMAFILDYGSTQTPNEHFEWRNNPMACIKENNLWDETTCRRILCPTGMKRNSQGECVFVIKRWLSMGMTAYVSLSEMNGVDISSMDGDTRGITEEILQHSPWPASWQPFLVLMKERDGLRITDASMVIGLTHTHTPGKYPYRHLVSAVNRILSTPWVLKYNGTLLKFNQSILEYKTRFQRLQGTTPAVRPFWTRAVTENSSQVQVNDSAVWLISRYQGRIHRTLHFISKLYLCKQVDLQPDEFDTIVNESLIKNRLTEAYMFDQEFEMLEDESGRHVARVCLSDTPFQEKSSACHMLSRFAIEMVCVLMVFSVGCY